MIEETKKCTLCQLDARRNAIVEGTDCFCCYGCQAVYKVLFLKETTKRTFNLAVGD